LDYFFFSFRFSISIGISVSKKKGKMGTTSSKQNIHFVASEPKDVLHNLEWALREQMAWEDRVISPKQLLMQDQTRMAPPAGMSRDEWERARAMAVIDMADAILSTSAGDSSKDASAQSSRSQSKSKQQTTESSPAGSTLTPTLSQAIQRNVIGTPSPPFAMPLSNVTPSSSMMPNIPVNIAGGVPTASRTFAAAAAEAVPSATSEMPSHNRCNPSTADVTAQTLNDRVSLQQMAAQIGGGISSAPLMDYNIKGLSGFTGIDAIPLPKNLSNTVHPDIAKWNPDSMNERKEIAAKYLFIHQLLEKLVKSAEYCYKLNAKHGWLSSHSDSKRAKQLGATPLQTHHVQRDATQCLDQLMVGLANFDNARASVRWLYRDFELVYAIHKLNDQIALIKARRLSYSIQREPSQVIDVYWSGLLNEMERRHLSLDNALQANELESLSLGLTFLDINNSGGLEPYEVPELNANLYALLDVNKNNKITHTDLQMALSKLTATIKENLTRKNELDIANVVLRKEANNESNGSELVKIAENEMAMKKLALQIEQDTANLRAINQYFHSAFSRHVFNKLDADVSASEMDMNLLFDDIECVSSKCTGADPLSLIAHPTQPALSIPGATTMIHTVPVGPGMIGTTNSANKMSRPAQSAVYESPSNIQG